MDAEPVKLHGPFEVDVVSLGFADPQEPGDDLSRDFVLGVDELGLALRLAVDVETEDLVAGERDLAFAREIAVEVVELACGVNSQSRDSSESWKVSGSSSSGSSR